MTKIYRTSKYEKFQLKLNEGELEEIELLINSKLIQLGHERIDSFTYNLSVSVEESE